MMAGVVHLLLQTREHRLAGLELLLCGHAVRARTHHIGIWHWILLLAPILLVTSLRLSLSLKKSLHLLRVRHLPIRTYLCLWNALAIDLWYSEMPVSSGH